uniref:ATP synthase F0 subunit 8 n=2 Tax=Psylliodes TaxID=294691 RepID=A0A7L9K2J2_9CUCU|nr:ATP synthase F0 subunit 8 [Psylliodes chlorophana]QOH99580.1 ATP synthase F0 subunit 8 [Psylliodes chlorophana]QOK35981.1 ATP synthase F0 subunit 8 [Psylliodes punctifrons]
MPQMMPLNWMLLMWFFTLMFYLFNNMNYFSFCYNKKAHMLKFKLNKLTWKW